MKSPEKSVESDGHDNLTEEKTSIIPINDPPTSDPSTALIQHPRYARPSQVPILVKTISYGLNGLCIASLYVASSKLLVALGKEGSGASSLVAPYQSVLLGATLGPSYATGLAIGAYIGKEKYSKAGNITKAAWLFNVGLGTIASGAMLVIAPIFPHLFPDAVADTAISYFQGAAIGNIAMLTYVVNAQLAMAEGHWFVLPLTGVLLAAGGATAGYFLAFPLQLGALGVGLGTSISQVATCTAIMLWFQHPSYKKYNLYQHGISKLKKKIQRLWNEGWKLSFQRLTEWGNLFLIVTVIGIENSTVLRATAPAIQCMIIAANAFQSLSQATGMLMAQNKGAREKAIEEDKIEEAENSSKKNISVFRRNIAAGVVTSVVIGGTLYALRNPIVQFFLKDPEPEIVNDATALLWNTMLLGLPFDSIRLISIGALRAWKLLLYPAFLSLLIMTLLGVPIGYALTRLVQGSDSEESDAALIFYVRAFSMLIAGGITAFRVVKELNADVAVSRYSLMPPTPSKRAKIEDQDEAENEDEDQDETEDEDQYLDEEDLTVEDQNLTANVEVHDDDDIHDSSTRNVINS